MKNIILLSIILLITSSIAFANCDNIEMEVIEVHKNESCYTFFSVTFQDVGCEYGCFNNISDFIVKQGETVLINRSGIYTTYWGVSFKNPECNGNMISMIITNDTGEVFCQEEFDLEEELTEWEKSENNYSQEENETNDEDIEEIVSEKIIKKEKSSSPGGSAPSGSDPSINNEPITTNTSNNTDISLSPDNTINPITINVNQESEAINTNEETKTTKTNYFIYIIPALIIILLIQIVVILIIKNK